MGRRAPLRRDGRRAQLAQPCPPRGGGVKTSRTLLFDKAFRKLTVRKIAEMGNPVEVPLGPTELYAGQARRFVNGRTVVMILSDGYDSAAPGVVGDALARLKKRGCRVIWLNPLKGWTGYAPVAQAMAAALPHLDLFAAANTLADLAALDRELARI